MDEYKKREKESYDKYCKDYQYKLYQKVWLYRPDNSLNCKKLAKSFHGPYFIREKLSENRYKVSKTEHSKIFDREVHRNLLRPYHAQNIKPVSVPELIRANDEINPGDFDEALPDNSLPYKNLENSELENTGSEIINQNENTGDNNIQNDKEGPIIPEQCENRCRIYLPRKAKTNRKVFEVIRDADVLNRECDYMGAKTGLCRIGYELGLVGDTDIIQILGECTNSNNIMYKLIRLKEDILIWLPMSCILEEDLVPILNKVPVKRNKNIVNSMKGIFQGIFSHKLRPDQVE